MRKQKIKKINGWVSYSDKGIIVQQYWQKEPIKTVYAPIFGKLSFWNKINPILWIKNWLIMRKPIKINGYYYGIKIK